MAGTMICGCDRGLRCYYHGSVQADPEEQRSRDGGDR